MAVFFFSLSILLPSNTVFAEPQKQEEIDKVEAEKIYNDWKKIMDRMSIWDRITGGGDAAEQEIVKKYNISKEKLKQIIEIVEDSDFKNKQIHEEMVKQIQEKRKQLKKIELSPKEMDEITKQVRRKLDPNNEYWEDYIEYRNELIEKKEEEQWLSNCEYIDVICHTTVYIGSSMMKMLGEVVGLVASAIKIDDVDFYGNTSAWYVLPNKENVVLKYQRIVQELAWTFLGLFLSYQSIRVLALYSVEVNSIEIKKLILRLVTTSILIYLEPYMIKFLLTLNRMIHSDLLKIGSKQLVDNIYVVLGISSGTMLVASPFLVTIILMVIVLMVIIVFQIAIRFTEIAILSILGPFAIATNMNDQYNLFPVWWKSILAAIFTASVQIFLLTIMFAFITHKDMLELTGLGMFTRPLLLIGFLFVIFKTPGFLREWMHSTGSTRMGVSTVTSFAKTAIRFVKP